jgi:hypothetical protein
MTHLKLVSAIAGQLWAYNNSSEPHSRTFWCSKVYHVTVFLEHVDLFDCLNWLGIQLLQGCLQFLVIADCRLVDLLGLSSWCALAAIESRSAL